MMLRIMFCISTNISKFKFQIFNYKPINFRKNSPGSPSPLQICINKSNTIRTYRWVGTHFFYLKYYDYKYL